MDGGAAADELVVVQQLLVQQDVGLDALDDHLGQRDAHARDRLLAIVAVRDDLADHRVVVRRHEVVLVCVRVDADAGPPGGCHDVMRPGDGTNVSTGPRR